MENLKLSRFVITSKHALCTLLMCPLLRTWEIDGQNIFRQISCALLIMLNNEYGLMIFNPRISGLEKCCIIQYVTVKFVDCEIMFDSSRMLIYAMFRW